jgi:hypothetical protein
MGGPAQQAFKKLRRTVWAESHGFTLGDAPIQASQPLLLSKASA